MSSRTQLKFLCVAITMAALLPPATPLAQVSSEEMLGADALRVVQRTVAQPMVQIDYEKRELVDFINDLAARKNANVVLPMGANAIKAKLTLKLEEKLPLDEAWSLMSTVLRMADYQLMEKPHGFTIVKMNVKETSKEPVKQLFVNTDPDELPSSDELIRYTLHLQNMKMPAEGDNELSKVLAAVLPDGSIHKPDLGSNSIFIAGPAHAIQAAVKLVRALDLPGLQETMEIIPLHHASADVVTKIFNENILKQGSDDRYSFETKKKPQTPPFFRNVRIVPEPRTNSLIVIGKSLAVERVKNFVFDYMDVELESGRSVIHTYKLQYLNAEDFEPVLKRIVESSRAGGTEQARTGAATATGPERFFQEVVIKADRPRDPEKTKYYGGNKLIIVARHEDWVAIEKIIKQLDQPLPQVLIEVLIADMSIEDTRLLGSLTRNPARIPMPGQSNFQSAQIGASITTDDSSDPHTIGIIDEPKRFVADLLGSNTIKGDPAVSTNTQVTAGSTLISLNDTCGETWSIIQMLKLFSHTKILSHPHIIATHNKEASITAGESRVLPGEVQQGENSNNYQRNERVNADTVIKLTPRISYASRQDPNAPSVVNLDVEIDVSEFLSTSTTAPPIAVRKIVTNTNVGDNSILAIGGLIQTKSDRSLGQTPLLGEIPVIGWFFKKRQGQLNKTSLTVFIRPTIVEPNTRGELSQMTKDYISLARLNAGESALFDSLKDPITRWFFDNTDKVDEKIDRFVKRADVPSDPVGEPRHMQQKKPMPPVKKTQHVQLKQLLAQEENPFARA